MTDNENGKPPNTKPMVDYELWKNLLRIQRTTMEEGEG